MATRQVVALRHLPVRPSRVLLWWWMLEVSWRVWGAPAGVWRGAAYTVLTLLFVAALVGLKQQKEMEPMFIKEA